MDGAGKIKADTEQQLQKFWFLLAMADLIHHYQEKLATYHMGSAKFQRTSLLNTLLASCFAQRSSLPAGSTTSISVAMILIILNQLQPDDLI